jgi:hypothetical protein
MTYTKTDYIQNSYGTLVGRTIVKVRPLSNEECEEFMWSTTHGNVAFAFILDDGTALVPSADPEGNSAGYVFKLQDGEPELV